MDWIEFRNRLETYCGLMKDFRFVKFGKNAIRVYTTMYKSKKFAEFDDDYFKKSVWYNEMKDVIIKFLGKDFEYYRDYNFDMIVNPESDNYPEGHNWAWGITLYHIDRLLDDYRDLYEDIVRETTRIQRILLKEHSLIGINDDGYDLQEFEEEDYGFEYRNYRHFYVNLIEVRNKYFKIGVIGDYDEREWKWKGVDRIKVRCEILKSDDIKNVRWETVDKWCKYVFDNWSLELYKSKYVKNCVVGDCSLVIEIDTDVFKNMNEVDSLSYTLVSMVAKITSGYIG